MIYYANELTENIDTKTIVRMQKNIEQSAGNLGTAMNFV